MLRVDNGVNVHCTNEFNALNQIIRAMTLKVYREESKNSYFLESSQFLLHFNLIEISLRRRARSCLQRTEIMQSVEYTTIATSITPSHHFARSGATYSSSLNRSNWKVTTPVRSSTVLKSYERQQDREALFAEFQPLVQKLIRQYGDDSELREDLVGEIYCRFCSVLDAFDPTRGIPLKAYLVHQLGYSVYSFVRCQWRRHRREVSIEVETLAKTIANPRENSQQWDDNMMMREVQDGLPSVIAELSLRQRQVVIWRYYESCTFEEIALRLDIQMATARSTLRHALRNIRRKLTQANLSYE